MWNLFVRLGMVLSTLLVGKQIVDHFWPTEIHPTRLYRPEQVARYLGTTTEEVMGFIRSGALSAKWVNNEPVVLGMSVLHFLSNHD
jgi:hypothetical protein